MIPQTCIDDILRVIKEQQSIRILFIADKELYTQNLYHSLSSVPELKVTLYNGEDINELWDAIVISDFCLVRATDFSTTIEELLAFVNHSIFVVSPTYLDENGHATTLTGTRYMHPVRFAQLDFSYMEYDSKPNYTTYNFFRPNHATEELNRQFMFSSDCLMKKKQPLNILFPLPHKNLTGGLKSLLNHARYLHKRGHNVYLMCNDADIAIPEWSHIVDGVDITGQIPDTDLRTTLRTIHEKQFDIIVLGLPRQIRQFIELNIPMLYWEQGVEHLYGDYRELLGYNHSLRQTIKDNYTLPCMFATVSPFLRQIMSSRFGRITPLLPTGIDLSMYYPTTQRDDSNVVRILLVGDPRLPFKGFPLAITVLNLLAASGYKFEVTWACQAHPSIVARFPITYKVSIPQAELAALYRTHDIYLNTSLYESFALPPLEAMASGIAVVATDCGGINTYAVPGENILLVEQGNFAELFSVIAYLLENPSARKFLGENGRNTALSYGFEKINEQMEQLLYQTIACYNTKEQE